MSSDEYTTHGEPGRQFARKGDKTYPPFEEDAPSWLVQDDADYDDPRACAGCHTGGMYLSHADDVPDGKLRITFACADCGDQSALDVDEDDRHNSIGYYCGECDDMTDHDPVHIHHRQYLAPGKARRQYHCRDCGLRKSLKTPIKHVHRSREHECPWCRGETLHIPVGFDYPTYADQKARQQGQEVPLHE